MEVTGFTNEMPPILTHIQEEYGFKVFTKDPNFDLNIIGVRNPNGKVNSFDDFIYVVCKIGGYWFQHRFVCTTDPGLYYLHNPMNVKGTAIMKAPQQMRNTYRIDKHQGRYEALCHRTGTVKVWRDRNKDSDHDTEGDLYNGRGINIHRSGATKGAKSVGRYSAGCQVIQDPQDFEIFMDLCRNQVKYHPSWETFTYTLIETDHAQFEK